MSDKKAFDRETAEMIFKDLSKLMYPNYDISGEKTLVIKRDYFEDIRRKYLDNN